MGREIGSTEYTRSQRTRYRRVLRRHLDLFETFLDTAEFVDEGTVGVELEMNLARTDTMAPALLADLVVEIAGGEYMPTVDGRTVAYDINTNTNYNPEVEAALEVSAARRIARYLGALLREERSRDAAHGRSAS